MIIAGLWTEVCVTMPTLEAMADGYEVYVVTDASGGTSKEAHEMAVLRMLQAGAAPVTWQQVLLEWERDWNNKETYNGVTEIIKEHSGAYGQGIAAQEFEEMNSQLPQVSPEWSAVAKFGGYQK